MVALTDFSGHANRDGQSIIRIGVPMVRSQHEIQELRMKF